jgi:hypothetical protein
MGNLQPDAYFPKLDRTHVGPMNPSFCGKRFLRQPCIQPGKPLFYPHDRIMPFWQLSRIVKTG